MDVLLNNLKLAIIEAFLRFQASLENGRSIENYIQIKEAICLEDYITLHDLELKEVKRFMERSILNLKFDELQ